MAPPFRIAEFDILFNEGISHEGSLIDVGVNEEVIEKRGTWLTICGSRFQGREAARQELKRNPKLALELETAIKKKLAPAPEVEKPLAAAKS